MFRELSNLERTRPDIKIIAFNAEGIFTNAPIDVRAVREFMAGRDDMEYTIYIDTHRIAVNGELLIFRYPCRNMFPRDFPHRYDRTAFEPC